MLHPCVLSPKARTCSPTNSYPLDAVLLLLESFFGPDISLARKLVLCRNERDLQFFVYEILRGIAWLNLGKVVLVPRLGTAKDAEGDLASASADQLTNQRQQACSTTTDDPATQLATKRMGSMPTSAAAKPPGEQQRVICLAHVLSTSVCSLALCVQSA